MTDFADAASDLSDYHLALSLRQHANRCNKPIPLPECPHCETNAIHVTKKGLRLAYCTRCAIELGYEIPDS